jgi:hypothetical protein
MALTDEQRKQIQELLNAMHPEIDGIIKERDIAASVLLLDERYPAEDHVHPLQVLAGAKAAAIAHANALIAILQA